MRGKNLILPTKFSRRAAARFMITMISLVLCSGLSSSVLAQSKYKTLYKFKGGKDGIFHEGGLVLDQAGNLYGTTAYGGSRNCGIVYELSPSADGSWTKKNCFMTSPADLTVHLPVANLIFDQAGNLYGTTLSGGQHGAGMVFELSKNSDGSWTEKRLHDFTIQRGAGPCAGLIFDGAGNLYGTTRDGGVHGDGVVFKLTPKTDGTWKETVLYFFLGVDGGHRSRTLFLMGQGISMVRRFMAVLIGGGTVFKLTPNSSGRWRGSVLHSFTYGKDGGEPVAGLVLDKAGNLYGTTYLGGVHGRGVVFELTPNADGSWAETVLHAFTGGKDKSRPLDKFIFDVDGNLYGPDHRVVPPGTASPSNLRPTRPANGRRRCFTPSPTSRGPSPMLA